MQTQLVQMFAYVDSTCLEVCICGLNLLRGLGIWIQLAQRLTYKD